MSDNGWSEAQKLVSYRLDATDESISQLQKQLAAAERSLRREMSEMKDRLSADLTQLMTRTNEKIAKLEGDHREQKVKVAALSVIASSLVTLLMSFVFRVVFGAV